MGNNKKRFYTRWWFGLIIIICIIGVAIMFTPALIKSSIFLNVENTSLKMNKHDSATLHFKTNKNNQYKLIDRSNNDPIFENSASTGDENLIIPHSGKYKLVVYKNGQSKSKNFIVKPQKVNINKLLNDDTNSYHYKNLSFGQSTTISKGKSVAAVEIDSVKVVSSSDAMVADIAQNPEIKKFVVVTYKLTAIKDSLNTNNFDNKQFKIYDSKNTIGIQSTNKAIENQEQIPEGQSSKLQIGVGLKTDSNNVFIRYHHLTWHGAITD